MRVGWLGTESVGDTNGKVDLPGVLVADLASGIGMIMGLGAGFVFVG